MSSLEDIAEKVRAGTRLSFEDGVRLFRHPNVAEVGALANDVRERLHGDVCWFNRNVHVNATNVCEASCVFCSFARLKTGDPQAWTMSYEDALKRIRVLDNTLVTEVHIVNGLNPDLPFYYYLELILAIKAHRPDIHVKGFTAVEIQYYSEKYDIPVDEVLRLMRSAGLDSLPGGGAEIFHPRARKKLCDDKVDADGWLAIHREAHRQGMFTNCTMLFGSIETVEERVDHLLRLRDLQDESLRAGATDPNHRGGHFQVFIPLRFHNDNNRLARLASPTGYESLRTIAVSRLLLDNIPHVKAYWPMLGTHEAQTALWFGASDLDGTVREEHIYHMAGAETPQGLSRADLVRFIEHAGRVPVERDTLYNTLRRDDPPAPLAPCPVPARVGWVAYSNAEPLVRHLQGVTLRGGHPTEVARWLEEGEVDIALLPVGALLSDDGPPDGRGWRVVPDVCIGADGAVQSVLLVAETPPESWTSIRLDGVSRTSVLLARLLVTKGPLAARLRPDVKLVDVEPGEAASGAGPTDAALVIGDAAFSIDERFGVRLDLAAEWKAWTGLPFVFAVWAGRADVDPRVIDHLRAAGLQGVADLSDPSYLATMDEQMRTYLTQHIRHTFDDAAIMGLRRFASLAYSANMTLRETWTLAQPPRAIRRTISADLRGILDRAVAGVAPQPKESVRLLAETPLTSLMLAANARRERVRGGLSASYGVGAAAWNQGASGCVELRFGDGESWDHLVARVGEMHDVTAIRAHGTPSPDAAVSTYDNSATRWLRITAWLRLVMPADTCIVADWASYGRGLAQLALRGGADDIGAVSDVDAGELVDGVWPMSSVEAERLIRLAGFQPVRRDERFVVVGAAETTADDAHKPLRRLDRPSV